VKGSIGYQTVTARNSDSTATATAVLSARSGRPVWILLKDMNGSVGVVQLEYRPTHAPPFQILRAYNPNCTTTTVKNFTHYQVAGPSTNAAANDCVKLYLHTQAGHAVPWYILPTPDGQRNVKVLLSLLTIGLPTCPRS